MTTQMIIRIESEKKNRLSKLARIEGKTTSQKLREIIDSYIQERDISVYVDDLWNRVGKKLAAKGVQQSDINKAIKQVRKK
jgi:predicted DNA-binding protein